MRPWSIACLSLLVLGGAVSFAHANGAPLFPAPPALKPETKDVKFVVVLDDKATQPRLEVPRGLLVGPAPRRPGFGAANVPTVVAGLALSFAFVSGGLWLSKRGRKVAASLLVVSLLTFSGAAYADLVRPRPKPKDKEITIALPAGVHHSDKVTLKIVENGDAVRLVVSKKMLVNPPRARADAEKKVAPEE